MSVKCCFNTCSEVLTSIEAFRGHFQIVHSCEKVNSFMCTIKNCGSSFMHFKSLLRHLQNTHQIRKQVNEENIIRSENKTINAIRSQENNNDLISNTRTEYHVYENIKENYSNKAESELEAILLAFLRNLHGKSSLTKKLIIEIFQCVKENILDEILSILNISKETKQIINKCYEKMNTQYKFEKILKAKGMFAKANAHVISFKTGNVFKNGASVIGTIKESVSVMPIKHMFKCIFSLPNILHDVISNIEETAESQTIKNFINGKRWKEIRQNYSDDDIVIPFDYYTYDFETGNALGSNSGTHKITAHYISFPNFPQHLLSSTKYVFECLLFPARLKKDIEFCVEKVIQIFKDLEENGIEFELSGETRTVYFVLARILGDNLGLNEILGFSLSFNSQKFCRICTIDKAESQRKTISTENDIRCIERYEDDLSLCDQKLTGIRERCHFNDLINFHCTKNIVCDVLHDVFEGLAKYDTARILKVLIEDKSLVQLTLENINILKQNFNYGNIEIGNLSKPIEESHLKNNALKMSASECKTFISFLPLMIGHLVPRNNKYWKLLLKLVDLSEFIMLSEFTTDDLEEMKSKIKMYNTDFIKLFGNILRPKHHFVSHYKEVVLHNGPLRSMMTFLYERKNKEVKNYANVTNQRINIAQSLSYKASMRFGNFLDEHSNGFPPITKHTREKKFSVEKLKTDDIFTKLSNEDIDILCKDCVDIKVCDKISHRGTTYDKFNFIVINQRDPQEALKIVKILKKIDQYFLIVQAYNIVCFDKHFQCFELGSVSNILRLVDVKSDFSLPFNVHKICNGKEYFKIKYI